MNVSENNELKGNIEITEKKSVDFPYKKISDDGFSFENEMQKLLLQNFEIQETDPSLVQYSLINPINQFEPINTAETITFEYDTNTIENTDAMFFLNLANKSDTINIKLNNETSVIDADGYKTMQVSKTLGDMLIRASENNKVLRLDFDQHVTVVLKVSKDGKIDASFIPQNKEVENYLKNNIDYLKVRFDEQSIAYSNISYKPYRQPNNSRRQNKGDKNE